MKEFIIFLVGSIGFVMLSRKSFINQPSHGFPRFFVFEAILGLVVLNAPLWFTQPFSFPQLVSWILLTASAFLAIHAFRVLHAYGRIDRSIQSDSQQGVEKTTRLVTEGAYGWIRHPLYASLFWFAWGIFLKQINLVSALLALIASLALFLTSVYEEQENLYKFGDEYASYMQHTKRFIPFLF